MVEVDEESNTVFSSAERLLPLLMILLGELIRRSYHRLGREIDYGHEMSSLHPDTSNLR